MATIDFRADLNREQYEVATAPDGPVLVLAAAGTGKTRALTYRVAHLVEERSVDPARILLLTFTNKAAREMMDRAVQLVGERVGGLWGGTFHHMANRMLRRHARVLGYTSDFSILDQDDARSLLRQCLAELKLNHKEFPKPEVLGAVFSLAANRGVDERVAAVERFSAQSDWVADVLRVGALYRERKRSLNAMDFDDLLVNGLRLFEADQLLLEQYQHHFQYILVDEYQDTNPIQSAWVDALAQGHRNVLAVGDDFQSIYAWRGADFRNIMSFPNRYPDAHIYKLVVNYRSVPEILDVANACIAGNPDQFQKTLTAIREPYQRPIATRPANGFDQARFIVDQIRRLRASGYPMEQMAVLYRAHFHAMELQLELSRENIPYVLTSGVRFFEQAHIKDVCTPVRLVVRPSDRLAFTRLLCLLPRIGERTAIKIWDKLGRVFPLDDPRALAGIQDLLPAPAREAWRPVADMFQTARDEHLHARPGEIILRFAKAFYDAYANTHFDSYERRIEEINELVAFSGRYRDGEAFINEIALLTNVDTGFGEGGHANRPGVRLSTVHQAKGLEWAVVFVPWLTDGLFPSLRSLNDEDVAEERRLFYVCVTRAKDELYLCAPHSRRTRDGATIPQSPSRFLSELPASLLKLLSAP
jgi:DNA helicase-2/ATP-dependent DNA helicase PcrA